MAASVISPIVVLTLLVPGVPAPPASYDSYEPDIGYGAGDGYGQPAKPNCHWETVTDYVDKCEDYDEETCVTQNKEHCDKNPVKTCTSVVKTVIDRACFNVTELVCELVESINYLTVEETFHVQRCYTAKDRVCDTVHEIETTTKDDFQCVELVTPNCHMEDKILVDKVCTKSVEFKCDPIKPVANDGYGVKKTECKRIPKEDCYDNPRTVQVEVCVNDKNRFCDKLTKDVPYPIERQNCHFERKKICQLVPKSKPKKAKSYSYMQDCKPIPREICDQCTSKKLEAECEYEERLTCKYTPEKKCETEHKKYCYKAEISKPIEVCDKKLATTYL